MQFTMTILLRKYYFRDNFSFFDLDSMRNVKLNDKLEFGETLNMKEFMLEQVIMDSKAKSAALKRQHTGAA